MKYLKLYESYESEIDKVNDFIDYLHNDSDIFFTFGDSKYKFNDNRIYFPLEGYGEYKNQFIEEIKNILLSKYNDFEIDTITDDNLILRIK